jgi:hypothetical protein
MPSPDRAQRSFPFSLLSLLAAPLSWAAPFASGRNSAGAFSEAAANRMFALLWVGAALVAIGIVLGLVALRTRASRRLLGIVDLRLHASSFGIFAFCGLFWVLLGL